MIAFPLDMEARIQAIADSTGKVFSWHVRQACIEYLERNGVDISNLTNPEGRGVRSDLRKIPQSTFDKVNQKANKNRKDSAQQ